MTAQDNDIYVINVEDSTNGTVTDSTADDNGFDGIFLRGNHMVTVSNSDASFNAYDGVYDEFSLDTIDADTMNDNGSREMTNNRGAKLKTAGTLSNDIPGRGLYVDEPLTVSSSSGQLYYTIEQSAASDNYDTGFYIDDNSPTTLYQAKVFKNTATFNGTSGSGFGFYAYQKVKGYGNGVRGNASGNCHNVACHSIP